jgi:selenoprotein W-related protein
LAAALKDRFKIESTLIEGSGGVFDVRVNGELIFSKKVAGRFPDHDEIIEAVSQ